MTSQGTRRRTPAPRRRKGFRPPRKVMIPLSLAALALALTASLWPGLAADVITHVDHDNLYSRSFVRQAIGTNGLAAEIYGAPQAEASPSQIARALELPASFTNRRVHAIEAEDRERHPNRAVILFNAGFPQRDVPCRTPETIGARGLDGGLNVVAVLCFNDEEYGRAALRNASVTGLDDSEFTRSMRQLFLALMPLSSQEERDRRGGGPFGR